MSNINKIQFTVKHLWKVLYNDCSISPNPLAKMATIDNSCFWLVDFQENLLRNHLTFPVAAMFVN
jgi:hypothetical protein